MLTQHSLSYHPTVRTYHIPLVLFRMRIPATVRYGRMDIKTLPRQGKYGSQYLIENRIIICH